VTRKAVGLRLDALERAATAALGWDAHARPRPAHDRAAVDAAPPPAGEPGPPATTALTKKAKKEKKKKRAREA